MTDAERRVKAVTFQLFEASRLLLADGPAADVRDLNRSWPARPDPTPAAADDLQWRTLGFVVRLLLERPEERGWPREINAGRLAELLYSPTPSSEQNQGLQALTESIFGVRGA